MSQIGLSYGDWLNTGKSFLQYFLNKIMRFSRFHVLLDSAETETVIK